MGGLHAGVVGLVSRPRFHMIGLGTTKAERGLHSIGLDSFDVLTLAHGIRKAYAVSEKVKRETRLGVTRKADAHSVS